MTTTNEMNVEKIIKESERMILRSMSIIDTKEDNDGLAVNECNLRFLHYLFYFLPSL